MNKYNQCQNQVHLQSPVLVENDSFFWWIVSIIQIDVVQVDRLTLAYEALVGWLARGADQIECGILKKQLVIIWLDLKVCCNLNCFRYQREIRPVPDIRRKHTACPKIDAYRVCKHMNTNNYNHSTSFWLVKNQTKKSENTNNLGLKSKDYFWWPNTRVYCQCAIIETDISHCINKKRSLGTYHFEL
jgi:hypothetical protein